MRFPVLIAVIALLAGCTIQNPEWAESINPCCGQDEVLAGEEPSEDRCADMVISQEAAMRLAWQVAAGSGMTHWRVRLIPGGPACIWRKWPGLADEDFIGVKESAANAERDAMESTASDTSASAPAVSPPPQTEGGSDGDEGT